MSEVEPTDEIWVYGPHEERDIKLGQGWENLEHVKQHLRESYNHHSAEPLIIKKKLSSGEFEEIQPFQA